MGTPGDRGEEPEKSGGESEWQSGGWQSQWREPGAQPEPASPAGTGGGWQQQPGPPGGWQQQPGSPGTGPAGWTRAADGSWVQTGPSSSGKATAALVLGILGLVFCPLICSVLALVFGYQGRGEIDASGGRLSGRGNATAGIVLGWIGVVLCVLFVILVVIGVVAGGSSGGGGSGSGVPA